MPIATLPSPWSVPLPGLRRAHTRPRPVEGHVVEADDGTALATDVHRPVDGGRHPTVLVRTPYGRTGLTGAPLALQARLLAARGYAVVLQDVRGRFDSGGTFRPMVDEVADGGATIDWLTAQPWSDGTVGAFGLSYLGGTAWAAAAARPEAVRALALGITRTTLALPDPRGVLHLDTTLRWLRSLEAMARTDLAAHRRLAELVRHRLPDPDAIADLAHLPVLELDRTLREPSEAWRLWAEHPSPEDPFWAPADLRDARSTTPPTTHVGGWWDIFVEGQLDDVAAQQDAGVPVEATIGPWGHLAGQVQLLAFRRMLVHFDAHLLGLREPPPPGVRAWVGPDQPWVQLDRWPPPDAEEEVLEVGIDLRGPRMTATWDPRDPTPSLGGRTLAMDAGRVDCSAAALREDVVTLHSPPLPQPVTVLGRPRLHLEVELEPGGGDVWARVADVGLDGRAISVADGLVRLSGPGHHRVEVEAHPVGHTFGRGHRIQVQLAGGSFPLHDRHLGDAADPLRATTWLITRRRYTGGRLVLPRLLR